MKHVAGNVSSDQVIRCNTCTRHFFFEPRPAACFTVVELATSTCASPAILETTDLHLAAVGSAGLLEVSLQPSWLVLYLALVLELA